MSVFIRRFTQDPGNEVLTDIESVNILDLEPPASLSGLGSGVVLCVGEFEDGPFEVPTEITSGTDMINTFGELGYRYAGVPGNNPSARSRNADGAVADEFWNGNGFVQLARKSFRRLLLCRVDTSVGEVQFTRQAYITGGVEFRYNLEPAQVLSLSLGAAPVSATFNATAATVTTAAGVYPTGFVGGETLTLGYDSAPDFTITFLSGDTNMLAVIARINAFAGFVFAVSVGADTFSLTGRQRGNAAQVRVVSGSAGVLTALGLTAATTMGTGNVANIDAVTFNEVKSIVETAISGTKVVLDQNGALRISKTFVGSGDFLTVGPATTALGLGFAAYQSNSNDGRARILSGAGTYPTGFVGGETLTLQSDDNPSVTVTFTAAATTQAIVIAEINLAMGYVAVSAPTATTLLFVGRNNGGSFKIVTASAGSVLTTLGLVAGVQVTSSAVNQGFLPAGTVVQNAAGTRVFVTMETLAITVDAANGVGGIGPYTAKVRHALDNGTGQSAAGGTITVFGTETVPTVASFSVVNPMNITACLTETQLDAQYLSALDATLDVSTVARDTNLIFSARQANQIRRKLRENVLFASANGHRGRMAIVRPPFGTTRAQARSTLSEPGVGAYRSDRVIYTYPGVNVFIPIIGLRGLAAGEGFTADGNVNVGSDAWMASVCSQLAPEENPGQLTAFTAAVNGLETTTAVLGWDMTDYKNFRSSGIAAPRMDDGTMIFQSGVTSVDPSVYPNLRNIARRRMADFIQDTMARRSKSFGKKLSTFVRRRALATELQQFLESLLSRNNPSQQRIDGYTLDPSSGNTPNTLAQGIYRIIVKVRTLSTLDSIVLETTIGESVEVTEQLPQAA